LAISSSILVKFWVLPLVNNSKKGTIAKMKIIAEKDHKFSE
jgi:hypothetical protein